MLLQILKKRSDYIGIVLIAAVMVCIFYPVFYAEYLYTDEAVQLWYFKTALNFHSSVPQGRYFSYLLFNGVFNSIHTIQQIRYARIFSLVGWIFCLPVWYVIITRIVSSNGLPKVIGQLSMVYMVCTPALAISIGWASCMELFITCTSGLISGYILYNGIRYKSGRTEVSATVLAASLLFGLVSLFTYQNGFGCFFIPFFIHLIAAKKGSGKVNIGLCFSLVVFLIYYLLFQYMIRMYGMQITSRGNFATEPVKKLVFFVTRPLSEAFHFTWLSQDKSASGFVVYLALLGLWMTVYLIREKSKPLRDKLSYLILLMIFFILIYFPSMIVNENYSSNRTLFALNMAVFFLVSETLLNTIINKRIVLLLTGSLGLFFIANARYNFNKEFLDPLIIEYRMVKNYIGDHYEPATRWVYFIRPGEDAFEKKYGVVRSWDEFGVPSTAKVWTPEPLVRQLVFEKTGDRKMADSLVIKSWPNLRSFKLSRDTLMPGTLMIDMGTMISSH